MGVSLRGGPAFSRNRLSIRQRSKFKTFVPNDLDHIYITRCVGQTRITLIFYKLAYKRYRKLKIVLRLCAVGLRVSQGHFSGIFNHPKWLIQKGDIPPERIVSRINPGHDGFMKTTALIRKTIIVLGFSTFASTCFGTTIALASGAGETKNNSGSATIDICKNPKWADAMAGTSWVSNVQSGNPNAPGFVSPVNGTSVTFTDTFDIAGTATLGDLLVMADDTTSVLLNGITLYNYAPANGNTYAVCSDSPISCTSPTAINLLPDLHSGVNTLSFTVEQINGSSFGLDYSGIVAYTPAATATPEPATLAMFGLPLIAFGLLRKKLKKS